MNVRYPYSVNPIATAHGSRRHTL